jgi:hypothetical protein
MSKFYFNLELALLAVAMLYPAFSLAQFCEKEKVVPIAVSSISAPKHVPNRSVESEVIDESYWLNTLDEAAIKALNETQRMARRQRGIEYGGCLFANAKMRPSKFYYTIPVTNYSPDGIRVSCKTPRYASNFVGLYHTHPEDLTIDGFSQHDIEVAESMNVTSYVGSMYSNNILKFQSCKTKKVCLSGFGSGSRLGACLRKDFSHGELIGQMGGR